MPDPNDPLRTTAHTPTESGPEPGPLPPTDVGSGGTDTPAELGTFVARLHALAGGKPPAAADGLPGVPGFEVTAEIARGGMGVVYAARDPSLGRDIAIKTVLAARVGFEARDRFLSEARVTGQLQHPGIPPVHALGELPDERPFLAMKLIRGQTLAALLAARPSPTPDLPRFVAVFEQVCQAVGYAHRNGVIHRDLKPGNVMVGAFGEVQVMDWGLAKVLASRERERPELPPPVAHAPGSPGVTETGAVLGTPAYMPPEQARGEIDRLGPPADVFALGGILCDVLTGRPPFSGSSTRDVVRAAAAGEVGDCFARLDACGADAELVALCKRCLAPVAADRPADGIAVADAVASYRAGVEDRLRKAEAERAAAEAGAAEQRRKRRWQLAAVAAGALLVLAGGAFAWWREKQAAGRREREAAFALEQAAVAADRQRKAEEARAGIDAALRLAADLRRQYRFREAADTLAQAQKLQASGGVDDLGPVLARAADDLAFVRELDDIRMQKWVMTVEPGGGLRYDTRSAPPAYRRAFLARGYDLPAADPAVPAAAIAASDVRTELLAAVEDWALFEPDPAAVGRLLAVARRSDPDPWTDRVRDPAVRKDKAKLSGLAAEAERAAVPVASAVALAELMTGVGLDPGPLLRAAHGRNPNDFQVALARARQADPVDPAAAVGHYRSARALRPDNAAVLNNLGTALTRTKHYAEAVESYRAAGRLGVRESVTRANLGYVFLELGEVAAGLAEYQAAVAADPTSATGHNGVGGAHADARNPAKNLDAAVPAFTRAAELDPKAYNPWYNLGQAHTERRDWPAAVAAYQRAVAIDPKRAIGYLNLGVALENLRQSDGALAAYTTAARLDPTLAVAHRNRGVQLRRKNDLDGAEVAYREAIRVAPDHPRGHYGLGLVLEDKGDADGAISAYRQALLFDANFAKVHCNLGLLLRDQGRFAEALTHLWVGHELGLKDPAWPYKSDRWVSGCEDLLQAEGELAGVLAGRPAPAARLVALADLCREYKKRYALAVRFYADALAAGETAARYNAACAAALAAAGRGHDAPPAADRPELRARAFEWLTADLLALAVRPDTRRTHEELAHWLADPDLATLRHPFFLAGLPAEEARQWLAFWEEVRRAHARTAPPVAPAPREKR